MLDVQLRKMREQAGYTQVELSAVSGVSRATITRIETRSVTQVRPDTLTALAAQLNASVDQLLDFAPAPATIKVQIMDPDVDHLMDGYRRLSPQRQSQLRDFLRWLSEQDGRTSESASAEAPNEHEPDDSNR